ncbi:MAG: succinylglutamate desuccinylase/aspartoacylase family protein [Planctomycetes bacterium]|nr:succinylglutamate desuccinylase/aspartoacylase family protein [Planctomycetota bacterium]
MRRACLLCCLLTTGCIGFHPKDPKWRQPAEASTTPAAKPRPELAWREVGRSVRGRSLRTTTLGHGPRRVLWVGGIHGDETEGMVATASLPFEFLAIPDAEARVTLTILDDANPDGRDQKTRGNANGVDLNRNFPAPNFKPIRSFGIRPLSQPEAQALHDLILALRPHLIIVAHSWRGDHFINYDGPAEEPAARFARLSGYPLRASDSFAPTPGSLGSWVGNTLRIPILTLEYLRGRQPDEAWAETRTAILSVILEG